MKPDERAALLKGTPWEHATPEQCAVGSWVCWCHHEFPCEPLTEPPENRLAYIARGKASGERQIRRTAFRPAKTPPPESFIEAQRAREEAWRIMWGQQEERAWQEARRALREADRALREAERTPEFRAWLATECPDVDYDPETMTMRFPKKKR